MPTITKENAHIIRAKGNTPEINARRGAAVRANAEARKARQPITEQLINELHNIDPELNMSKMRLLVKGLVAQAIKDPPDMVAVKEIFDRVEGKARQQVDVTHDGDVSVRSAALSFLDQVIADVLRADAVRVDANVVPERPVLPAPLHLPEERSGEPVDLLPLQGGAGES